MICGGVEQGQEGWLRYNDGEIYPLSGATSMLTSIGLAGIKAMAPKWLGEQRALFTPRPLGEEDGVRVNCEGAGCTLTLVAAPPSVHAVWIEWSPDNA